MASTLHRLPARELVKDELVARLAGLTPGLFPPPALDNATGV